MIPCFYIDDVVKGQNYKEYSHNMMCTFALWLVDVSVIPSSKENFSTERRPYINVMWVMTCIHHYVNGVIISVTRFVRNQFN